MDEQRRDLSRNERLSLSLSFIHSWRYSSYPIHFIEKKVCFYVHLSFQVCGESNWRKIDLKFLLLFDLWKVTLSNRTPSVPAQFQNESNFICCCFCCWREMWSPYGHSTVSFQTSTTVYRLEKSSSKTASTKAPTSAWLFFCCIRWSVIVHHSRSSVTRHKVQQQPINAIMVIFIILNDSICNRFSSL